MLIKNISVTKINPAPYNPRIDLKPGDPEYHKLERSLDSFGLVEPLVWNRRTGHLVGGHQRFKVLLARGYTHIEVSVVDLPLDREKALNLALNKIIGDWDRQKLAELLDELCKQPDFDLGLTGFDPPDANALIADVLGNPGGDLQDAFDVEGELKANRPLVTKPGDLIILGKDPSTSHRLACGDCTDAAQVQRVMNKERASLFATDPPYLVNYTARGRTGAKGRPRSQKGAQPTVPAEDWDDPDLHPDLYKRFIATAIAEALQPDATWYCWHASRRQAMLEDAWTQAGAAVHQQIIWAKSRGVLSRSWYLWQHEPCLMGWRKGKKPRRRTAPMLSTVWHIEGIAAGPARPDHPTPKPVELFGIPLRQHTRPGEVCYEPFAGSGTQLIAAQALGRRCYALELSPRYCDLIVRRFIAAVGEKGVEPRLARRYRVVSAGAAA